MSFRLLLAEIHHYLEFGHDEYLYVDVQFSTPISGDTSLSPYHSNRC